VASECSIDEAEVVLEQRNGLPLADDFSDWASLLRHGEENGVIVTAFRYSDATSADVTIVVGDKHFEEFHGSREVLRWIPFFCSSLIDSASDSVTKIEVKDIDVQTFRFIWGAICSEDLSKLPDNLSIDELWSVLAAAHSLGMKGLHNLASLRLQELLPDAICAKTASSWVARARRCKAEKLFKASLVIVAQHPEEVLLSMATEDWSDDLSSYESIVRAVLHKPGKTSSSNGGA
jgi:hypothetical protein